MYKCNRCKTPLKKMYAGNDTMFCPNKKCVNFLNTPKTNVWYVTYKRTVPVSKRYASVEEEVIDIACKEYKIQESDILDVDDGDKY